MKTTEMAQLIRESLAEAALFGETVPEALMDLGAEYIWKHAGLGEPDEDDTSSAALQRMLASALSGPALPESPVVLCEIENRLVMVVDAEMHMHRINPLVSLAVLGIAPHGLQVAGILCVEDLGIQAIRYVVAEGGESASWRPFVVESEFRPQMTAERIDCVAGHFAVVLDSFRDEDAADGGEAVLDLLGTGSGSGMAQAVRHALGTLVVNDAAGADDIRCAFAEAMGIAVTQILESAMEENGDDPEDEHDTSAADGDTQDEDSQIDELPPVYQAICRADVDALESAIRNDPALLLAHGDVAIDPLLFAINRCSEPCAKRLLALGADANSSTGSNIGPLALAILREMEDLALDLLDRGADPHVVLDANAELDGETTAVEGPDLLWMAAHDGLPRVVERLLGLGFDPNRGHGHGDSALYMAVANGHEDVVDRLLKAGAEPDYQDARGNSTLKIAAAGGNTGIVEQLLRHGATVDLRNEDGWTALISAAECGDADTVRILLAAGADPNLATNGPDDDGCGRTPLIDAAHVGSKQIVSMLLEAGADINAMSMAGATAFRVACLVGHTEVAMQLFDAGADPDAANDDELPILATLLIATLVDHDADRVALLRTLLGRGVQVGPPDSPLESNIRSIYSEATEQGNETALALGDLVLGQT